MTRCGLAGPSGKLPASAMAFASEFSRFPRLHGYFLLQTLEQRLLHGVLAEEIWGELMSASAGRGLRCEARDGS